MDSAQPPPPASAVAPSSSTAIDADERILHVLNRFTYGPRPGDVERLKTLGLKAWFSQQMSPQQIDDSALDARLADFPAMALPLGRMMAAYPTETMIRQVANGRISAAPGGEAERAIYANQLAREKDKKTATGKPPDPASQPAMGPDKAQSFLAMPADQRFSALCRLSSAELKSLRQALRPQDRDRLTDGFTPKQMEEFAALQNPQGLVAEEATEAKLIRDIYTERQLNEVMVDFWLNHFNVYIKKSQQAPYYIASYERTAIRPRALGRFEDLLVQTATSPAMLNYLDNQESVGPHSIYAFRSGQDGKKGQSAGLNENYARELMELHTMGVGSGYTQRDVTEVAKVFTGWTVGSTYAPQQAFAQGRGHMTSTQNREVDEPVQPQFDESKHEPGSKVVLGVTIKEGGLKEGLQVLHMLATSPATAKFISHKLAVRFVSDDPPQAMVDRMAATFLAQNGDIRQVLATMVNSPEFFAASTYRVKVKTPQEFVVSAVRASGAEVTSPASLVGVIAELGMPLYGMQTPNGYSMRADPWNNTGALVSRMNFALALSANRVPGVTVNWPAFLGTDSAALTPQAKDSALEDKLLHMAVSDRTRTTILNQISTDADKQESSLKQMNVRGAKRDPLLAHTSRDPVTDTSAPPVVDNQAALAAGLLFGSPEFQRR